MSPAEPEPPPAGGDTAGGPIRVLVVDDHRVVAHGLTLSLSHDARIDVVGVAVNGSEAIKLAAECRPDVVLLDYHLPDATGAEVAERIRADCPDAAVVILTADSSEEILLRSVKAGACGFLLKSEAAPQVIEAVHRAAEGEMLIPPAMLVSLLSRQRPEAAGPEQLGAVADVLTPREREILMLMAQGSDNRAISDRLVISYSTVRTHVQNILDKLNAHSKLGALAIAQEMGLLQREL